MGKNSINISPETAKILKTVGENIRLARLCRKINQTNLSKQAGITRVTLSNIEKGTGTVCMSLYANVLFCLNLQDDLLHLAKDDELGRNLQDAELTSKPKTNTKPSKPKSNKSSETPEPQKTTPQMELF